MKKAVTTIIIAMVWCVGIMDTLYAQATEEIMNQGNVLLSSGAYDQAVTQFRKVLGREPKNFEAQFNLALSYLNWGKYQNAISEFKKASSINPRNADIWSNIAAAYEAMGQSKNAIDALARAVDINPKNIRVRMNLASIHASKGNVDKAISEYKAVIGIDAGTYDAFISLAKCYESKKLYDDAKLNLKTATGINPNEGQAYWELGIILWKHDRDYENALSNIKKAVGMKPNVAAYHESLALLLEELWKINKDDSKRVEAIDSWNKYLIYTDDAFRKDETKNRIAQLEAGNVPSPTGRSNPDELFGSNDVNKQNLEKLKNEMRQKSGSSQGDTIRNIRVQTYDVGSDLSDLDKSNPNFDFDMNKAVEEKKKAKKN